MNDINRRDFIKMSAGAGIGSLVIPDSFGAAPIQSKKKVIVAGGGIGGLCCAYELMKRGHEVVLMEASGRHGGHVFTLHDGLSDGLYADLGGEHFTKPGYTKYWEYTREFNLTVLPYPHRQNMLRRIDGKFYTEAMLADPAVLKKMGFNDREVKYLSENPWWDLRSLYTKPYLDKFKDEYQPFGVGYDDLDNKVMADLYKKDGASATALGFMGGTSSSALFDLWQAAILNMRGVPIFPPNVFRLKGGNQMLPNEFAKRLGDRVRLNCPILSIKQGDSGVTVKYKEFGEEKEMSADYLANCIPLPAFKSIPIEPALPAEKRYVIDNTVYGSYARVVFQASSKFWEADNLSINMELNHPEISELWQVAEEVETHRVALMGTAPAGITPQRALAAFRSIYPGKHDTIETALVKDWSKETFAYTCERLDFPKGQLKKFWPHVMEPAGRIHFAGAYADNLNWGMEAATRSANRVASEIDQKEA